MDGETVEFQPARAFGIKCCVALNAAHASLGATIKADLKRFGRLPSIIIEQGATIIANGTETAPITMTTTATQHQLNRMSDTRGLWGGLAIFGSAPIGTRSSSGTELFNFQGAGRFPFGGSSAHDDSGLLSYVVACE
eukprot:TRINITY_DN11102_c0_g1_i6.p3 TRINITY_DN11102_c0_g1~~TRINITY_DN11102_c0_g1_i6.p3  ORF type:complete len:137 (+),score=22.73 TRINITY_DN11102_c0_g1_i6:642-1052(+)